MILRNLCFAVLTLHGDARKTRATVEKRAANGIRKNSFGLIEALVKPDENIAISPLSILGAMYMLAAGAAGESRTEILNVLNFGPESSDVNTIYEPFKAYSNLIKSITNQPEKGYKLSIANAIFHQKDMGAFTPNELRAEYMDVLKSVFIRNTSNIQEVDFQQGTKTKKVINGWISEQTNGKIPEMYKEPLGADTLVVLASTLYFKASWQGKFDLIRKGSAEDKQSCFATSAEGLMNSQCADVQWMVKEGEMSYFPIKRGNKMIAQVVDVPLKNKKFDKDGQDIHQFTMQLWVPDAYITDSAQDRDFRKVIKNHINRVRNVMTRQLTRLTMPKFEIEYKDGIIDALRHIGINSVFDVGADLSPILGDSNNAYVEHVNHAVKLTVDENGVEGAAVTTVGFSSRTINTPAMVNVNKPFYFVINNRCWKEGSGTGTPCTTGNVPLFIGRYVKP